jgi:DNA-binding GntR family transcriptional regulator
MSPPKESAGKQAIYKQIRTAIITSRMKPGERLVIEQLKSDFGTSVTPIRDALLMLSQEGLLTIKPRSGYYVTRVTLKELTDMLDLRAILELAAVELAAANITRDEIARLKNVHAGYTTDTDEAYWRYTEENRTFHYLVARASGNRELARQIGHLHDRLARFMIMVHSGKEMAAIHRRLMSSLKAHDVRGAREALQKELSASRRAMLDHIMEAEADTWHLRGTANK